MNAINSTPHISHYSDAWLLREVRSTARLSRGDAARRELARRGIIAPAPRITTSAR